MLQVCTRYISPDDAAMERLWRLRPGQVWRQSEVFPRRPGPFIRRNAGGHRELVIGQWALIPWFAQTPHLRYSTNNARYEEIDGKASYRDVWAEGKRCIIPAWSFDEPNWETGRNVWWRFRRRDGAPWGLAGLWSTWTDKVTGEIYESYTMLTVNADAHPLISRMHKPDPKYGPDEQDKRSVVAIDLANTDRWLDGRVDEVRVLVAPPAADLIEAGPVAAPTVTPTLPLG